MRISKSDGECFHNFHIKMGLVLLCTQHSILLSCVDTKIEIVSTKECVINSFVHKRMYYEFLCTLKNAIGTIRLSVYVHMGTHYVILCTQMYMAFSEHDRISLCTQEYKMEWCVYKSTRLILFPFWIFSLQFGIR